MESGCAMITQAGLPEQYWVESVGKILECLAYMPDANRKGKL